MKTLNNDEKSLLLIMNDAVMKQLDLWSILIDKLQDMERISEKLVRRMTKNVKAGHVYGKNVLTLIHHCFPPTLRCQLLKELRKVRQERMTKRKHKKARHVFARRLTQDRYVVDARAQLSFPNNTWDFLLNAVRSLVKQKPLASLKEAQT